MMKGYLIIACLLLSAKFSFAQFSGTASAAPDAYGYVWRTDQDTDPSKPTARWIDISNRTGTIDISSKLDDDNIFGPINFSFDFPFYWYTRNQLYISANGAICFKPNTIAAGFDRIPTVEGQTDDYIAVFTSDLQMNKQGANAHNGRVLFYTDFKDTVIVSWIEVPFLIPGGVNGSNTFQVVLNRADGSITMNYNGQVGEVGNGCTDEDNSKCFVVGIENVSGQVGLSYTEGSLGVNNFKRSNTAPMTIKYYRPQSSNFQNRDLAVRWNSIPSNGGILLAKDGKSTSLISNIANQGLTTNPEGKVTITGRLFDKNSTSNPLFTTTKSFNPLLPNTDTTVEFGNKVPVDKETFIRFETFIKWDNTSSTQKDGDQISANNKVNQYIGIVDTTKPDIRINYTGSTSGGAFTFLGGVSSNTYSAGVGTYYEFPFYPVKVKSFIGYFNTYPVGGGEPVDNIRIVIYDDDGVNLFGVKDGSPGTVLFDSILTPILDWSVGENIIDIVGLNIQINSGGVYLAAFQGGSATSYGVETDNLKHYRGYEVFNGVFSPFRNNDTQDIMLGLNVEKGDITKVTDLVIDSILSPLTTDVITEDVDVKVSIKNIGQVELKGPFEILYKADSRDEVIDTVPSSFVVAPNTSSEYTFKAKAKAPPFPRTNYEQFCVRAILPNDFNVINNEKCFKNKNTVGINSFAKNINNLIVYPNPTDGILNLTIGLNQSDNLTIKLVDMQGKTAYIETLGTLQSGFNEKRVDLSSLQKGLYVVMIQSNEGISSQKVQIN